MKFNQIFLSAIACSFAFISCDDQVMEWGTPEGHNPISSSEIPLSLAEKIANYDYIRAYAQQYTPNMTIGLGLGATNYIEDEAYRAVADANFQVYTTGNAMKHSSVVKNNGSLDFSTIDNFLALVPQDVQIYGHNFLWHTQQKQAYLKSLIAPEQIIETTGNVANILSGDATDFNGGSTGGWGSWGSNKNSAEVVAEAGEDGSACLVLSNNGDGNAWEAQCAYTFDEYLSTEATYIIKFKAKSTAAAGELQFQYQNGTTYGSQGGYNTFTIGTGWSEYEYEFTVAHEDVNRIILNFGKVGATYYIDDIQFGEKIENKDPMANIVTNYSFEDGTNGWTGLWGKYTYEIVQPGHESDNAIHFTISNEFANMWDAQLFWAMNTFLEAGKTYAYSFWAKSDCGLTVQVIGQNASYSGIYKDVFTPGTDWTLCEGEFTYNEGDTPDIERMGIQFGGEPGSQLWVDDFKFGEKIEQPAARSLASRAAITYVYKTAEEKKEILL
ncbi:MAG: carbohydrate binding domain-containing protein, partial [Bacteroides sp.]|nr:carbohydrate binding domain-containing protein [Bacteroides sp.]